MRSLGEGSLQKLKNRYQYVDLESNEFIPDVIKEKLNQKCGVCCDYQWLVFNREERIRADVTNTL